MIKGILKNEIDSLTLTNGKLEVPLVVINKDGKLLGFVPALHVAEIWGEVGQEEVIIEKLRTSTKEKIREMVKNKEPFPFFMDRSQIVFEFNPVKIEYLVAQIKR